MLTHVAQALSLTCRTDALREQWRAEHLCSRRFNDVIKAAHEYDACPCCGGALQPASSTAWILDVPRLWVVMFEEQTCSSCGFESIDGGEFFLLRKDTFHGALGNFELCFSHEFMREMADELVDGVHFYTRFMRQVRKYAGQGFRPQQLRSMQSFYPLFRTGVFDFIDLMGIDYAAALTCKCAVQQKNLVLDGITVSCGLRGLNLCAPWLPKQPAEGEAPVPLQYGSKYGDRMAVQDRQLRTLLREASRVGGLSGIFYLDLRERCETLGRRDLIDALDDVLTFEKPRGAVAPPPAREDDETEEADTTLEVEEQPLAGPRALVESPPHAVARAPSQPAQQQQQQEFGLELQQLPLQPGAAPAPLLVPGPAFASLQLHPQQDLAHTLPQGAAQQRDVAVAPPQVPQHHRPALGQPTAAAQQQQGVAQQQQLHQQRAACAHGAAPRYAPQWLSPLLHELGAHSPACAIIPHGRVAFLRRWTTLVTTLVAAPRDMGRIARAEVASAWSAEDDRTASVVVPVIAGSMHRLLMLAVQGQLLRVCGVFAGLVDDLLQVCRCGNVRKQVATRLVAWCLYGACLCGAC